MGIRDRLDQLSPERRFYTLRSLAYHLKESREYEHLYELLDREWMQVKLENDKSYKLFSDDINLAIQASVEQETVQWAQMIRLGLIYVTIREMTTMIPPIALGVMVGLGQVERSLSFAALIHEPQKSAEAYMYIASALIKQSRTNEAEEYLEQALQFANQIDQQQDSMPLGDSEKEKITQKVVSAYLSIGNMDRAWEVSRQLKNGTERFRAQILTSLYQKGENHGKLLQRISSLREWEQDTLSLEFVRFVLHSDPMADILGFIHQAPLSDEMKEIAIRDTALARLHTGQIEAARSVLPDEQWENLAATVEKEQLLRLIKEYEFQEVIERVDALESAYSKIEILTSVLSGLLEVGLKQKMFRVAEKLQFTLAEAVHSRSFVSTDLWIQVIRTLLKIPSVTMAEEAAGLAFDTWINDKGSHPTMQVSDLAKLIKVFFENNQENIAENVFLLTQEFMDEIDEPAIIVDFAFRQLAVDLASMGAFEWAKKIADKISDRSFQRSTQSDLEVREVMLNASQGNFTEATRLASLFPDDEKKLEAISQAAATALEKNRLEQAAEYLEDVVDGAKSTARESDRAYYVSKRALYHAGLGNLKKALAITGQIWYIDVRMNTFAQIAEAIAQKNDRLNAHKIVRQLLHELSYKKEADLVTNLIPYLSRAMIAADLPDDVQILTSNVLAIEEPGKRLLGLQRLMLSYIDLNAKEKVLPLIPRLLQMQDDIQGDKDQRLAPLFTAQVLSLAGDQTAARKILDPATLTIKENDRASSVYWEAVWETLIITGATDLAGAFGRPLKNPKGSVRGYLRLKDYENAFQAAKEMSIYDARGFHLTMILDGMLAENRSIPPEWLDACVEVIQDLKESPMGGSRVLGMTCMALAASGQIQRAYQFANKEYPPGIDRDEVLAFLGLGLNMSGHPDASLKVFSQALLIARLYGRERFYKILQIIFDSWCQSLSKDQLEASCEAVEMVETWWSGSSNQEDSSWMDEGFTVPNLFEIGDGSPFVVAASPDLESIFTNPDPPSPLPSNPENEEYWEEESIDGRRIDLAIAYLQHPDPVIRRQMVVLAGQFDTIGIQSAIVDLMADTDPEVQKNAAQVIWKHQEDTLCRRAISELRKELQGNVTGLDFLQDETRLGRQKALRALEVLVENSPTPEIREELEVIIQEQIFIPERMETPEEFHVDFVDRKYRGNSTYEVYTAVDAVNAVAFLKTKVILRDLYYIEVDTPEGTYGRDINGIYKQ